MTIKKKPASKAKVATKAKTTEKIKAKLPAKTEVKKGPYLEKYEATRVIAKNIPTGTRFTGIIFGHKMDGLIYNTGTELRLCQNTYSGYGNTDKLGYKYSIRISYTDFEQYTKNANNNIKLFEKSKDFVVPEWAPDINNKPVVFKKGHIIVGCTTVPNADLRKITALLKD